MSPPRATPERRERRLAETLERLEELHAQLPALPRLGLCDHSCSEHIDASIAERDRLLAAGVNLDAPTPDGACPALSRTFGTGRCTVYALRPTICRLWGATASMPCPHGCHPVGGHVDDATAMRWMMTSLEIGGHHDVTPAVRDQLEAALTDPTAAGLLSRFLRGDRTIAAELYEQMLSLRPDAPATASPRSG